jgi:hypothetical protein
MNNYDTTTMSSNPQQVPCAECGKVFHPTPFPTVINESQDEDDPVECYDNSMFENVYGYMCEVGFGGNSGNFDADMEDWLDEQQKRWKVLCSSCFYGVFPC